LLRAVSILENKRHQAVSGLENFSNALLRETSLQASAGSFTGSNPGRKTPLACAHRQILAALLFHSGQQGGRERAWPGRCEGAVSLAANGPKTLQLSGNMPM